MTIKEMRNLSVTELDKLIDDMKKELFALKFQLATGQLQQTHKIKEIRRQTARAMVVRHNITQDNGGK